VVINVSSSSSTLPRGMAKLVPMYHPAKCAVEAITRCAFGMYQDEGVVSYGVNPVVHKTELTERDAQRLGWTVDELCAFVNPLPATGNPDDVGQVSAALFQGSTELEGGVHYILMPVPPELRTEPTADDDSSASASSAPRPASGSILFTSSIYGADRDSLDGSVMRSALQKIQHAYWSSGSEISGPHLEKIKRAMEEHRIASLAQVPPPVVVPPPPAAAAAATAKTT
jgi:hypothetical protein